MLYLENGRYLKPLRACIHKVVRWIESVCRITFKEKSMSSLTLGIDISKAKLDVALLANAGCYRDISVLH
jgi:hypothetical protein